MQEGIPRTAPIGSAAALTPRRATRQSPHNDSLPVRGDIFSISFFPSALSDLVPVAVPSRSAFSAQKQKRKRMRLVLEYCTTDALRAR